MNTVTDSDGILKSQDDTSDDASELSEKPQPLKVNPYISLRSLSDATGHFKKLDCKETYNNMCLFCNSTWQHNSILQKQTNTGINVSNNFSFLTN